jgi:hypothetical protein
VPIHTFTLTSFVALTAASFALSPPDGNDTPDTNPALLDMSADWSGCGPAGFDGAIPDFTSYTEGRIAFLRAELDISGTQKNAWQDYSDALRLYAAIMDDMHRQIADRLREENASPHRILELRIRMMKPNLAVLEALRPPSVALYRTLSPEQRIKADRAVPAIVCM